MSGSFFKSINDSEAGQFLSLGANFSGLASVAVQVINEILSLLSPSDTEKILAAINDLGTQIQEDFQQLGELIQRQTQIILKNDNRIGMATALSHSDAAIFSLRIFLRTRNADDLRFARNESVLGATYFTNLLTGQPPDPFFLPGLIKAGTTRIMVAAAEDPNFRRSSPADVAVISEMIALLASMIAVIKSTTDKAHFVFQERHGITTEPPRVVIEGFAHRENVVSVDENDVRHVNTVQFEFFHVSGLPEDEDDPRAAQAFREVQAARVQGVIAELAFIGVPGFDQVLQNWKAAIANPVVAPPGGVPTA
jgi:hypothetical protein